VGGNSVDYAPCGSTTDGYLTPVHSGPFAELGFSIGQDNGTTTSCKPAERKPHGRLLVASPRTPTSEGSGDRDGTSVVIGRTVELTFFGPMPGDRFRLFVTTSACVPVAAIGPIFSTLPDPDGDGSYLRLRATWPDLLGDFYLSAAWGNPACSDAAVGFTNCVDIYGVSHGDQARCDDGTIEAGWVAQIPSGNSDYFNNELIPGTWGDSFNGIAGSRSRFSTSARQHRSSHAQESRTPTSWWIPRARPPILPAQGCSRSSPHSRSHRARLPRRRRST
jgi:hypothetical protein